MGELFDAMKQRLEEGAKRAAESEEVKKVLEPHMAGLEGKVLQFSIEGEGDFYLEIKGGAPSLIQGLHPTPAFTMKAPLDVAKKMIITRELGTGKAYMAKQFTIEGSLAEAMKFGRLALELSKLAPKTA